MDDIQMLCAELEPVIGEKKARHAFMVAKMFPEYAGAIRCQLLVLKDRHLNESYARNYVYLPPPDRKTSRGDIKLGDVYYGSHKLYPFGLKPNELIQFSRDRSISMDGKLRGL